jgi:hypothetical protein
MGAPAVTASMLSERYGPSARYWIRMAAKGKIPGAFQPSGRGGKWFFDPTAVGRWWESRRKEVDQWPGYTVEARRTGDAPSVMAGNSAEALKRQIDQQLKSAFVNG